MARINKKTVLIFAFVFLFLFLATFSWLLKTTVLEVFKLPLKLSWNFVREIKAVLFYRVTFNENIRLNLENDKLTGSLVKFQELLSENERLKNILSFKEKSNLVLIPSRVIAQDSSNWSSCIIIDKGRSSGITKDLAVITPKGLIGRIIETTKNTSKVMLINDANFSVAAIDQRSRVQGVVSGRLYRTLSLRYLEPDADIEVGDIIVSSGMRLLNIESFCPAGIFIGKVVSLTKEFGGLTKCAYIQPNVDPRTLEYVLVISK